jgi:hypothetical protein
MERSPRLTTNQLPKDERVPKDTLLRGASPEEVAGAIRAWLANERPAYHSVNIILAHDETAMTRIEQRWKRKCRTNQIPEMVAQIDRSDRAVTLFSEIILLPTVVQELSSSSLLTRALGARTIMHEWWHASRRETMHFYPFEEGTAELFAERMCQHAFGFQPPKTWRTYTALAEAIELIGADTGIDNWYLASRAAPKILVWFTEFLLQTGFTDHAIKDVLSYTRDNKAWLTRVRRMISSKEAL